MRLAILRPAVDLAELVTGYCLCDDPGGLYDGQTLSTAPQLGACICVQLGGDVVTDFRDARPLVSYAGIQPRIRRYRPEDKARSLVIFLTPLGSIRFLPSNGPELYDEGHELGGIMGDAEILKIRRDANAAPNDEEIGRCADVWLRRLFRRSPQRPEFLRLAHAMRQINHGSRTVQAVARGLDLSERQLERSFREHLGVSPKRYQQIFRVTRSLHATLTGRGDPLEGYADQAHQVRNWQTYLGFTPGHVRRNGQSPLGQMFRHETKDAPQDLVHYL